MGMVLFRNYTNWVLIIVMLTRASKVWLSKITRGLEVTIRDSNRGVLSC